MTPRLQSFRPGVSNIQCAGDGAGKNLPRLLPSEER